MHCISLLVVVAVTVLEVVLGTPLQSYSENSTETRTVCLLPLDEGPCRGLLPRYYYNRFTQTCEEFAYGGCDGNANNFMFLEDCEKVCSKIKKVPKPCRLDADPGPCRAMFKKFAFNLHTMKCEKFMYGGCYGNDNNFKDEASCLESCAPKRNAPSFCYSPKDEGSCSASVTRYYFNIESKACEEFNYTGCGGNSNNFVKIEDCNSVCKKGNRKPKNRARKLRIRS
ncbi:tissue factor pathway inhibitor 2 [Spea bombifrons]|uniref:tissue factor pathway inhibitor 2 n=1 Tax=Spea bombifrons TaxID=233779 RepID=UPI00234932EB|nr:tissue factor pathway inhibitor 2 [Spea bombifrons]